MVTVLDSFEDGDVAEYSGDTGDFSTIDTPTYDGDFALECSTGNRAITRTDKTIAPEETPFGAWLREDDEGSVGDTAQPEFVFSVQSATGSESLDAYGVRIKSGVDEFVLERFDGGSPTTIAQAGVTLSLDTWYEVRITEWTSSGGITAEVNDTSGSTLATVSGTDNTYGSGGFGWRLAASLTSQFDFAFNPDGFWNWNQNNESVGVVHQSTTNTDHDDSTKLKQGYDYGNFSETSATPVGAYPFHEDSGTTVYDLAGTNDLSVNGCTPNQVGLLETTAWDGDGTDDGMDGSTISGIDKGSSFSMMCWFNADVDYTGANALLVTHVNGSSDRAMIGFGADNGDLAVDLYDGAAHNTAKTPFSDTAGWHHVALVWSGSGITGYADGTEMTDTTAFTDSGGTSGLTVFKDTANGNHFDGRIADVRFYDVGLSASQVQTLYDVVATGGDWLGTGQNI